MSDSNGTPPAGKAVELLASCWPGPSSHKRHDACRALVGGLLRGGMEAGDVEILVGKLCEKTGDEEVEKRQALVGDTAGKLKDNAKVTGWPSLVKLLGKRGDEVVGQVKELLDVGRRIVATYDYMDEAGCLLFQTVHFDPKDFAQRRRDGKGGWIWNLDGITRGLYRLPELLAADRTETVYIPEGEKDVDNLRARGLVATCNPMGAGKWQTSYTATLRNRRVVVLADNDDPGREHARKVAGDLAIVAASVKVLELPNLPDAGDVSDWLAAGGTAQELQRLAEATPPWQGTVPATPGPNLPTDPPWPEPLGEEAFHGLAGEVAHPGARQRGRPRRPLAATAGRLR
jgi:hypothetical protein